ncbi:MAG: F0F1 ATP synthase subunit alpha, partial [Chlorobium sp.]|nr:F0F1 ATP synthase subunit alpha [Chlorobium sp.]
MKRDLQSFVQRALGGIRNAREQYRPGLAPVEEGVITTVSNGIAKVDGLPGVGFEELLQFPGNLYGIAFNLDMEEVGVVLLGDYSRLNAGD